MLEEKKLVRESAQWIFYGKVAANFFTCDKILLIGVTVRIAFRRSIDDFVIVLDAAAKYYKVKIVAANLYFRKLTLNDEVVSALEKTLLTSPAAYLNFENSTKKFLDSTALYTWRQEDMFAREPIQRLVICLNTNKAFLVRTCKAHFVLKSLASKRCIFIATDYQWLIEYHIKPILSLGWDYPDPNIF